MKGSVLTGKTWLLLIVAALLIAAGTLNFVQRLGHKSPAWDGVTWVNTPEGVVAKTVEPGSAAARAQLIPGDRLLGISMVQEDCQTVSSGITSYKIDDAKFDQIYT